MRRITGVMAACAAAVALVCADRASAQEDQSAPPPGANLFCPVMTDEPADPNFSLEYEGRTVYFCCRRCRGKFRADPTAYVDALEQVPRVPEADEQDAPHAHDESEDHDEQTASADDTDHANDAAPSDEHDQSQHTASASGERSAITSAVAYLGRFHVLVIHFPIALLILGALTEVWTVVSRSMRTTAATRILIGVGAISAVTAALLGLANALDARYTGGLADFFWWHRAGGIATATLSLLAWWAVERRTRRERSPRLGPAFALIMFTAAAVGITGHLGGSLVFGPEYLVP